VTDPSLDNSGMRRRRHYWGILPGAALLIGGCAVGHPSPASFSVRHFAAPAKTDPLDDAASVVRDFGYRVDTLDHQAGRLTTHPLESLPQDAPRRTGSSDSNRRVVEIRIESEGDAMTIYCKVLLQQQTTETHRLFAQDERGDDRPGRTPIEREAATDEEQNTVWETVGRDKAQERAILSALSEQLGPTADRHG